MSSKLIVYIGQDFKFADLFKSKLKEIYGDSTYEFQTFSLKNLRERLNLTKKLINIEASLFMVDYSNHERQSLKLARFLNSQSSTKNIPLTGLIGNEHTKHLFHRGLVAGMNIINIKSLEIGNIVYQNVFMIDPETAKEPKFAVARFGSDKILAHHHFRIGYVTPEYFHIETDLNFNPDQLITIEHDLFTPLLVEKFKVLKKLNTNLYYDFENAFDLEILPYDAQVDIPDFPASDEIEKKVIVKEEENERLYRYYLTSSGKKAESNYKSFKAKLNKWVDKNLVNSKPKRNKVLLIDEHFTALEETNKSPDQYPFSFRLHQFLDLSCKLVSEVMPNIIVINLSNKKNPLKEDSFLMERSLLPNDNETIKKVLRKTDDLPGYSPFVIVFNSQDDLEIDYTNFIAHKSPFDLDTFLMLMDSYKNKQGRNLTLNKEFSKAHNEKRIYLDKIRSDSLGSYSHYIILKEISEHTVKFISPIPIQPFSNFTIDYPIEVSITVIPPTKRHKIERNSLGGEYFGFINGIDEVEMQELRQYVNQNYHPPKEEDDNES
jgi:hypothetical protein